MPCKEFTFEVQMPLFRYIFFFFFFLRDNAINVELLLGVKSFNWEQVVKMFINIQKNRNGFYSPRAFYRIFFPLRALLFYFISFRHSQCNDFWTLSTNENNYEQFLLMIIFSLLFIHLLICKALPHDSPLSSKLPIENCSIKGIQNCSFLLKT